MLNVVGMHDSLIALVAQLFTIEETKEGLLSAGGFFCLHAALVPGREVHDFLRKNLCVST